MRNLRQILEDFEILKKEGLSQQLRELIEEQIEDMKSGNAKSRSFKQQIRDGLADKRKKAIYCLRSDGKMTYKDIGELLRVSEDYAWRVYTEMQDNPEGF